MYDIADLYKEKICIDLAFSLTVEMAGTYDKAVVAERFRKRVIDSDLLAKIPVDIDRILNGGKRADSSGE